jgi:integrase
LKWKQIDYRAGLIYLERKKSSKNVPQAVPIYGDMRAFPEKQPCDSPYLFARGSEQIKDFRAAWKTARKTAGVSGLLFHDLRRSAARNLRRAGVPESLAMKITGHRTRSMYERYNIVDEEDIREVGRKAGQFHSKEEQSSKKVHKKGAQSQKSKKGGIQLSCWCG